jgi:hypothetical protein
MKVYHLFSKNNKIGSRLISWSSVLEKEDVGKVIPSHIAILIEQEDGSGMVLESTLFTGVRFIPYTNWLKINTQVAKVRCTKHLELSSNITSMWGKKYDWYGIIYFGYRLLLKKFFDKEIPDMNIMERPNSYMCTEFVGIMEDIPYQMKTPYMMMKKVACRDSQY